MLSAILFDLDGTLVNTDPLHFLTWQEVLSNFGMSIDRVFYQKHISGRLNAEIVRDILPQLPLEEGLKVADAKEARFRQLGGALQPIAGLLNLLDWSTTRQIERAVVTNAPRANAQFLLDALKLNSAFSTVILAEEASRGKPDPAPYNLALKRLNVNSNAAIAFEDSTSGILSATRAGLYTIGVASTHDPQQLLEAGAKMAISDFTEPQLWEWLGTSDR
jgi:HAD superfamily hydrolase (TIGR01509 family)